MLIAEKSAMGGPPTQGTFLITPPNLGTVAGGVVVVVDLGTVAGGVVVVVGMVEQGLDSEIHTAWIRLSLGSDNLSQST